MFRRELAEGHVPAESQRSHLVGVLTKIKPKRASHLHVLFYL